MQSKQPILKIVGYCLTAVSFIYLYKSIQSSIGNFETIHFKQLLLLNYIKLSSLIFLYCFALTLRALSWKSIFDFLSRENHSKRLFFNMYFRSNIAKYIPGNIMHYASRNLIGQHYGWKQKDMAISSLTDTIFLIFSALLVTCSFSSQFVSAKILSLLDFPTYNKLLLFFIVGIFILFILYCKNITNVFCQKYTVKQIVTLSSRIILLNSLVFLTLGGIFIFIMFSILSTTLTTSSLSAIAIIGVFSMSWLIGFLTPGAPGGIGIREAILLFLLSSDFGKVNILTAVIIHRLISIAGDCILFIVASTCKPQLKKAEH